MPNILVRNLPPEVHHQLVRKAEEAGQSLQQYLSAELERLARTPTLDEVLTRIARRRGGVVGLAQAVDDLSVEREQR
ncbi:MAG: hypothetical protein HYU28_00985 [Actinobacteria bacterium]|nr:hypothetical protein [Actinomycetota bacterium]